VIDPSQNHLALHLASYRCYTTCTTTTTSTCHTKVATISSWAPGRPPSGASSGRAAAAAAARGAGARRGAPAPQAAGWTPPPRTGASGTARGPRAPAASAAPAGRSPAASPGSPRPSASGSGSPPHPATRSPRRRCTPRLLLPPPPLPRAAGAASCTARTPAALACRTPATQTWRVWGGFRFVCARASWFFLERREGKRVWCVVVSVEWRKWSGRRAGGCLRHLVTSPSLPVLLDLGLGIWSAFGRKDPLFRPFCIGRVSFCTQHVTMIPLLRLGPWRAIGPHPQNRAQCTQHTWWHHATDTPPHWATTRSLQLLGSIQYNAGLSENL
jgi:hypothetical protein